MLRVHRVVAVPVLLLLALVAVAGPAAAPLELLDLAGRPVDPLAEGGPVRVFLFTRADCPISNRYAPEVQRLAARFADRGVTFRLVYPDPEATPASIREHLDAFGYTIPALRDPRHVLVERSGARITPEAAVFDAAGRMVYRGRIDDLYVAFGKRRPTPTRRDLEQVLEALVDGRPVEPSTTRAVGCYIADLR